MGIVQKEFKHEELECEMTVDSHAKGEHRELDRNISLEVNSMDKYTPQELLEIGKWITEKALEIKFTFDSEGFPINNNESKREYPIYGSPKFIDEFERAMDETTRTSDR